MPMVTLVQKLSDVYRNHQPIYLQRKLILIYQHTETEINAHRYVQRFKQRKELNINIPSAKCKQKLKENSTQIQRKQNGTQIQRKQKGRQSREEKIFTKPDKGKIERREVKERERERERVKKKLIEKICRIFLFIIYSKSRKNII